MKRLVYFLMLLFTMLSCTLDHETARRMQHDLQRVQEMNKAFVPLDTVTVMDTVLDYYDSTDALSLTRKLRSIEAFKGIKAPMQKVEGGYVPDFHSRYFTEDFPYGLAIIRQLCRDHHISTPVIDKVFQWGQQYIPNND